MGAIKKIFGGVSKVVKSLTGGLLGGADIPKAQTPAAAPASTSTSSQSAADVINQEEEDRRRRLLALNANGGANGQLTPSGGVAGAAPVTRKTLMGQ